MLNKFVEIIKILRKKCPWDREQTIESLLPKLIEESYEALDSKNKDELIEEIGDVLTVVFMMIIILEEEGVEMDTVFKRVIDKLVKKHPHVFGEKKLDTTEAVLDNWEKMRNEEKGDFFKSLPESLPSLQLAEIVQERAARVGFDWGEYRGVIEKIKEELNEFEAAVETKNKKNIEEELGDLLFSIVNISRHLKISPEISLRKSTSKFKKRFNKVYSKVKEKKNPSLEEMDKIWDEVKKGEK